MAALSGDGTLVAAAHPAKVAELTALLAQLRAQGHSAPRLAVPPR